MKLSACIAGVFAFDENGEMIAFATFKNDAKYIAESLAKLEAGHEIPELKDVIKRLEKMGIKSVKSNLNVPSGTIDIEDDKTAQKMMQELFRKFSIDSKFAKNMGEVNKTLAMVNAEKSKVSIKQSIRRDKLIIHAINGMSDLDDISNRLIERLREWYSLHYPEINREIKDNSRYASLVWKNGKRDNFKGYSESMGMDIEGKDEAILTLFAKETKEIYDLRLRLEKYIKEEMEATAPNITGIAGHSIAARLLSLAGSLEKLAGMPASTIQLLGAEKALFRHMKGKGKPPKFGVLFAHPDIQQAPKDAKGRVARAIASKLAIAARVDFYSKEDRSQGMKKELKEKINNIVNATKN